MLRRNAWVVTLIVGLIPIMAVAQTAGPEWQLTFSPISKLLDNNDNFSRDGRFLVYDTRDTVGTGIGNSTAIMKVSVTSLTRALI